MLLTSWVRSFRESLLSKRRVRRGQPLQSQNWIAAADRAARGLATRTESLEERMLLTAFIIDQALANATPGVIRVDNNTIDANSDGVPEFDSIVIDSLSFAGAGGRGIQIDLRDLTLNRISVDELSITGAGGSGLDISLQNVDLNSLVIQKSSIMGSGGGGVDIDLIDVELDTLAVFQTVINGGLNAGLDINVTSVTRNSRVGELNVSGSTSDGISLTAAGRSEDVFSALPSNPLQVTVVDHGLQDGTEVSIAGVQGLTAANTVDTITGDDENTFTLDSTDGTGQVYLGGGRMTVFTTVDDIRITQNSITGATGDDGVQIRLTDTRAPGLTVEDNAVIRSIAVTLVNSPIDSLTIRNNADIDATRPQADGIRFDLDNSTLTNLLVDNNVVTSNGAAGANGVVFDATDSNVYGSFTNNIVRNTIGNGLEFAATTTDDFLLANRGPQVFDFSLTTAATRLVSGIDATSSSFRVIDAQDLRVQQVVLVDSEQMIITGIVGNTVTVVRGQRNTLAASHVSAADLMSVTSAGPNGVKQTISGNTFDRNDGAGIFAKLVRGAAVLADIEGNSFTANEARGIDIVVQDTIAEPAKIARGGISRTATELRLLDSSPFSNFVLPFNVMIEGEELLVTAVDRNVLTVERGTNGTMSSFHTSNTDVIPVEGDGFRLNIGGSESLQRNTFDGNQDGAIHLELQDRAAGSFNIANNVITNTVANQNTEDGDGIIVELTSVDTDVEATSILRRSSIRDNLIGTSTVTTVTTAISPVLTVFQVADASVFSVGDTVQIDGEQIQISNISGNVLTVVRGVNLTASATHPTGTVLALASAVTTLNTAPAAGITPAQTTFTVTNAGVFSIGDTLVIGKEQIQITNIVGNSLTVLRGVNNTTAATYTTGTVLALRSGGNADRGIDFFIQERSEFQDLLIDNNIVVNQGDDGIRFKREDDGMTRTVNPFRGQARAITITNNTVVSNALYPEADTELVAEPSPLPPALEAYAAGIEIHVLNGTSDDFDVDISDNRVFANRGAIALPSGSLVDGINLRTEADARILATVNRNEVRFNQFDGLNMTERANAGSDRRDISATLYSNNFSDNDDDGIDVSVRTGENEVFVIGQEGVDAEGRNLRNTINNNGDSGIHFGGGFLLSSTSAGSRVAIINNEIDFNGRIFADGIGSVLPGSIQGSGIRVDTASQIAIKGNSIDQNSGAGVDFQAGGQFTIRDNVITGNQNDGVEIVGSSEATILNNFVGSNVGRGLDLLVLNSDSNFRIGNGQEDGRNFFVGNQREGVYFMTTSSGNQSQNVDSDVVPTASNNSFGGNPNAIIQIDTNTIEDNGVGVPGGVTATGLRLRIGSSGATFGDDFPNSVAGADPLAFRSDTGSATGYGTVSDINPNSRTNARIVNNSFDGNFGDDVNVSAFVSTVDPRDFVRGGGTVDETAGIWDALVFDIFTNEYNSDPLSRLNLVFQGNTGNGLTAFGGGGSYNEQEPVFKSRDSVDNENVTRTTADSETVPPDGPFGTNGGRGRSITNVPSRTNNPEPFFGPNLPPRAQFSVQDVRDADSGNGVFDLMVTVNSNAAFPTVLPFIDGEFVEISGVGAVGPGLHTANGIYEVYDVDAVNFTFRLRDTGGHDGPQYGGGGLVVYNDINPLTGTRSFLYPGTGPSTFRVAQNFDTAGNAAADEFQQGSDFSGGSFGIWTPNPARAGGIENVVADPMNAGRVLITSPNHQLTNLRQVMITGVQGLPTVNGTFSVRVEDVNTFSIPRPFGTSYDGGGTFVTIDDSFSDPVAPTFPLSDVINVTPDPRISNTGVVTINFTERVDNVDIDDLFLTRDGVPVDISSIAVLQNSPTQYQVDLSAVTSVEGLYKLTVDVELPEATINPVRPDPSLEPIDQVTVDFDEDVTGVDIYDFTLYRDIANGQGFQPVDISEIGANLFVDPVTQSRYNLDLSTVTETEGTYRLTLLSPQFVTLNGLSVNGAGEYVLNAVEHGLATGQTIELAGFRGNTVGLATNLNSRHRILVDDADNFRLVDDSLAVTVTSDDAGFNTTQATMFFDSSITDSVGRRFSVKLATDGSGQTVLADATDLFVIAPQAPSGVITAVSPDPRSASVSEILFEFSEPIVNSSVDIGDFRLTRDIGAGPFPVSLAGATVTPLDLNGLGFAQRYVLGNIAAITQNDGDYRLTLITTDNTRIVDPSGLFLSFPVIEDWTMINDEPMADILDVFPDPRSTPVGTVSFNFLGGDVDGVDLANAGTHFTLTRDTLDGNGVQIVPLLDGGTPIPIIRNTDASYELDLTPVTSDGTGGSLDGVYTLTLNPGPAITLRSSGAPLAVVTQDSWVQDSAGPLVDIVDVSPDPRITNAGLVLIEFDEPVTGIDRFNAATDFTLTRDIEDGSGPLSINLTGVRLRALDPVDPNGTTVLPFNAGTVFASRYLLDLSRSGLTDVDGNYVLTLTATGSIADATGNIFAAPVIDEWELIPKGVVNGIDDIIFPGNAVAQDSDDEFFVDTSIPMLVPGTVSVSPDPRSTAVGVVTINFSENVNGFNLTDVELTRDIGDGSGPQSVSLGGLNLNAESPSSYTLDLNLVTAAAGVYSLAVNGTNSLIRDFAGNNVASGLQVLDTWIVENIGPTGLLFVTPDPRTTPLNNLVLSFSKPVDVSEVTLSDLRLELDTGAGFIGVPITGASSIIPGGAGAFEDTFTVDLSAETGVEGTYRVRLLAADSGIIDQAGIELGADAETIFSVDVTSPLADIVDIAPDPRNAAVGLVNVLFSEAVSGLDLANAETDFDLLFDDGLGGGPILVSLASLSVSQETQRRYTIDLSGVTAVEGSYELRLVSNTGIADIAGNSLEDAVLGPVDLAALDTWFRFNGVDMVNPTVDIVDVGTPRNTSAGVVTINFSEDVSGVDIADFTLTRDEGMGAGPQPVALSSVSLSNGPGSVSQYLLDLSDVTFTQGTFTLSVVTTDTVSPIVDASGNLLAVGDSISWVNTLIDPSAMIVPVDPDPRLRSAGIVTVNFSEAVSGVGLEDFRLTRDAGAGPLLVSLRGVTLIQSPSGADQYSIDLGSVTGTDGIYRLTLRAEGSGIKSIETPDDVLLSDVFDEWQTITTITVNTTSDSVDVNPGDGIVADSGNMISLRAAIMESGALPGDDTINLPAGNYTLSIGGIGEQFAATGDLDITDTTGTLTILGAGAGVTTIDAASIERIFHITSGATLILDGVTVTGGQVRGSEDGGGIRNDGGTVTIRNSVITGNRSFDDGGAINNAGTMTLVDTSVSGNVATNNGGGIRNVGNLTVINSTIGGTVDPVAMTDTRNTAGLNGGGIINLGGGTVTIANSTISGNRVTFGSGGGLFNSGSGSITNATIASNSAGQRGGGVSASGGSITVQNTIIAGNAAVSGGNDVSVPGAASALVSLDNNLVQDINGALGVFSGTNDLNANPNLGALQDNGGSTFTHALSLSSPAVDAGAATLASTDQRGIPRVLGNGFTDIGAYEFGGFFVSSTADSVDVNPGDGVVSDNFGRVTLRAAIMEANALASSGLSVANAIMLGTATYDLSLTEIDTTAPTVDVVDITPDPLGDVLSGLNPVGSIVVQFDEPVLQVDRSDFRLTFEDGLGAVTTTTLDLVAGTFVTPDAVDPTRYTITGLTNVLSLDGRYTFDVLVSDITDFALNPLAEDPAQVGSGIAASDQFVRGADVFAPTALLSQVTPATRTTNPGIVTVTFSEDVFGVSTSAGAPNFMLTYDDGLGGGPVAVPLSGVAVQLNSLSEYQLDLSAITDFNGLTDLGTYALTFDGNATVIQDASGNVFTGTAMTTWVVNVDVTAPIATIEPVTPDPRTGSVGVVTINFDEPVAGVDLTNAQTDFNLTFDADLAGGTAAVNVDLSGLTVTRVSDSQYTIDLTSVTAADGAYVLSIDPTGGAITDLALPANRLAAAATDSWVIGEDAAIFGDLDVTSGSLTIIGTGAGQSVVDAKQIDRVFDVDIIASLTLRQVTVTGGELTGGKDGAGVRSFGKLALESVEISGNIADGRGGGVYSEDIDISGTVSGVANPVSIAPGALVYTAGSTVLTVNNVGSLPAIAGFQIRVGAEEMLVIGISGNDLTVVRGINGTTAVAPAIGAAATFIFDATINLIPIEIVGDFPLNSGFNILIGAEQIFVTAITGNTFSVLRGVNGTAAASHLVGDTVTLLADAQVNVSVSAITDNMAEFGGGLFNNTTIPTVIIDSAVASNSAGTDGGGVFNDRNATAEISGSSFSSNTAGRDGGGLYNNDSATASLTDSAVTRNIAVGDGGGLYNELAADSAVTNSTVAFNTATDGGGIFNQDGVVTVRISSVSANTATNDGGGLFVTSNGVVNSSGSIFSGNLAIFDGGGIANSGTVNLETARVIDNTADGSGGGISNSRILALDASTVSGNIAFVDGGGIANRGIGRLTLTSSAVSANTASRDGGGIFISNVANLTTTLSTIDGNSAAGFGGGVYQSSTGVVTFASSTISRNIGSVGGGIFSSRDFSLLNSTLSTNSASGSGGGLNNIGGSVSVESTTVFANAAGGQGGGIQNDSVFGPVRLRNTIVARNTSGSNADVSGVQFTSLGNNLIGDRGSVVSFVDGIGGDIVGTTGSEIDPLLGILQNNGGATDTHSLQFGSPARDSGSNVGVSAADQRGFARVFDGDGNGVATVDIGAFESGFTVNTFADTVDVLPGDRSSADVFGSSSLRAAVMEANALPGDDTILLIPGTYRLTIAGRDEDGAATGDLDVTDDLTIIGAGSDQTFIDAADLDRIFHVLPGAQLDLQNLTIRNGESLLGGAVLNGGTLNLNNVVVEASTADIGGGLYNDVLQDFLAADISAAATTLTLANAAAFPANGPFDIRIGAEEIRVTTVVGNTYTVTRGFNGTTPVMHLAGSPVALVQSLSITDSIVRNNVARLRGGGIFNRNELTFTRATVSGNIAHTQGGGLYNEADAIITGTTFDSNIADANGGAIYNNSDPLATGRITLSGSTLSNNEAGTKGGGIYNNDIVTILNSTLSGNRADATGGGIYNANDLSSGTITITNATVAGNMTDGFGGGIAAEGGASVSVKNTIISGNVALGSDDDLSGAFVSLGTNFIGDAGSSTGFVNGFRGDQAGSTLSPLDAVFGPLADNGGPTFTHALLKGSPAIDAANNSGGEPVDQRGGRRPTDETADVGAFEVQENRITIGDVTQVEGAGGTTNFVFTVLLEASTAEPITVDFTTIQDTARNGEDFLPASGTVMFAPGELARTITVAVNGDTTPEATEQFFVQLSNPVNGLLIDDLAIGTILNDDVIITVAPASTVARTAETDAGVTTLTFVVELLDPFGSPIASVNTITVDFATSDGTAVNTGANPDYISTSGTLTFNPGVTSQTVDVMVIGDLDLEPDETVILNLSGAMDSEGNTLAIADAMPSGLILNDETSISIDSVIAFEGNSPTLTPFDFTVSLVQPNANIVTVDVDALSGTAISGSDFVANSTTVTFNPGETSKIVTVLIIGDGAFEADEQFTMQLSNATESGVADPTAVLSGPGTGTILNDEAPPVNWLVTLNVAADTLQVFKDTGTGPVPFTDTTNLNAVFALTADTGTQDDVFTIDFANGAPIPTMGLTINGADEIGGDSIIIVNGSATDIVYTSTGATSGTIDFDGRVITYTDFEPITDSLTAVNRTFNISHAGGHTIRLTDDTSMAGHSRIDSNGLAQFESVSFSNPTASLTVTGSAAGDTFLVETLDAAFAGSFLISSGGGDDSVDATTSTQDLVLSGGAGLDTLKGGLGNDTIYGGSDADDIQGNEGDDVLVGGFGVANDTIDGGAGNDILRGGDGDDSLLGGADDDLLTGGNGNDVLRGGFGLDNLQGESGEDTLAGDRDADVLNGGSGDDLVLGGLGADVLDGGTGDDTVDGGEDDDTVRGGGGNDSVSGGDGDDLVRGHAGDDTLSGGAGVDDLNGGADTDSVMESANGSETITLRNFVLTIGASSESFRSVERFDLTSGPMSSLLDASAYTRGDVTLRGQGGDDTLRGSIGNDSLIGNLGDDSILGDSGNDDLIGGAGKDTLRGGFGDDVLIGNGGDDLLNGDRGNDFGDGKEGDDIVIGGLGADLVRGGSGNDTVSGGIGNDTVRGDSGNDVLDGGVDNDVLFGGDDADTLNGGADNDRLFGGNGNDVVNGGDGNDLVSGDGGDDLLDGQAGNDTVLGGAGADRLLGGIDIDFLDGQGSTLDEVVLSGTAGNDTFTLSPFGLYGRLVKTTGTTFIANIRNTERIQLNTLDGNDTITSDDISALGSAQLIVDLGAGDDSIDLTGSSNSQLLLVAVGGTGSDTISGGNGSDTIDGGGGNDVLTGNAGFDLIDGGDGNDTISGGNGNDILNGRNDADVITGGDGSDTISGGSGNDSLDGGAGADTILGGSGNDRIAGRDGDDNLVGEDGSDTIIGEGGADTIDGSAGTDLLGGGAGNDLIIGGFDNDTLLGGDGNDTLLGAAGADLLFGMAGDDRLRGLGTVFDTLVGGTGNGDDSPGDTYDSPGEIDNTFMLDATLLSLLNF